MAGITWRGCHNCTLHTGHGPNAFDHFLWQQGCMPSTLGTFGRPSNTTQVSMQCSFSDSSLWLTWSGSQMRTCSRGSTGSSTIHVSAWSSSLSKSPHMSELRWAMQMGVWDKCTQLLLPILATGLNTVLSAQPTTLDVWSVWHHSRSEESGGAVYDSEQIQKLLILLDQAMPQHRKKLDCSQHCHTRWTTPWLPGRQALPLLYYTSVGRGCTLTPCMCCGHTSVKNTRP